MAEGHYSNCIEGPCPYAEGRDIQRPVCKANGYRYPLELTVRELSGRAGTAARWTVVKRPVSVAGIPLTIEQWNPLL